MSLSRFFAGREPPYARLHVVTGKDGPGHVRVVPSGAPRMWLAEGRVGIPSTVARILSSQSGAVGGRRSRPDLVAALARSRALVAGAFVVAPVGADPTSRALLRRVVDAAIGAAGASGASAVYFASGAGPGVSRSDVEAFWRDASLAPAGDDTPDVFAL